MEIIGASREKDNICNALGVEFGAFIREKEVVQVSNATSTAKVKIKGYKKFVKRIRKMRKEVNQLNGLLEKTVELKTKLF